MQLLRRLLYILLNLTRRALLIFCAKVTSIKSSKNDNCHLILMKIKLLLFFTITIFFSCKNETKKETETTTTEMSKEMAMSELSFGVRGNCGMCKKTIEKLSFKRGGY